MTFNGNGGDAPDPGSKVVTYGSAYGTLASTRRTGYTFAGWWAALTGGTEVTVTDATIVTTAANHTLYAQWTVNQYTVTFNGNGGDAPSPASKVVTYDSAYGTLAGTVRAGYTFAGWWTASDGGTEVTDATIVTTAANHTLYARWTRIERTILLSGNVPLELVWVPSGSYQMGRYPGEVDSLDREDPQHTVTLAYGFWMGKYEITQQQWLAVRGSWPGTEPSATYGLGNTYPAYNISWNDAKNFITSLNAYIVYSGQGQLTVRLPSEAEWEYACRAGAQTRFYWGDDSGYTQIGNYAWYDGNNSPEGTKPVGVTLPNGFGLYDMSGNVDEWCEDDDHTNYTGAPSDGSAWIDSLSASHRVVRGGCWCTPPRICRSAYRDNGMPSTRSSTLGFRVVAVQ